LVRVNLYLLLPICIVFALFLISQGTIQNFKPYEQAHMLESLDGPVVKKDVGALTTAEELKPPVQTIAQGPVASQAAIKMLGTNGGGFFNANAAHPYENPTPLANFLQMLSIFLIPSGLTYYLGRMVKNQRHGWTVWAVMLVLFLAGMLVCWQAESSGNPRWRALSVDPGFGNLEGKEVRFGVFSTALFATVTTDASCGAVNAMHDSFTPLGGLVPLFNIQLGEIVFGGVGSGLYGMLVFIVLTVFLSGLMVGRTPEYLGKKIETYDVQVSVFSLLVLIFTILGFTALATIHQAALAGLGNAGPHGLSEMLYAFSSAAGNNGSALAGLNGNSHWYNLTLGLAMLLGRFMMIVPIMALAGNLVQKKLVPTGGGSFPVWGISFGLVLLATILIVGALTFLPALALGPIVEHFLMWKSNILF
jgi:K+-transporting ATPase ATPase A chain